MGLFKRFRDVLRANINDMISRSENPEKLLNQMIIDMNEQLIESKKGVAAAIADEKRLERQIRETQAKAQEWEKKAVLAVKAGKDELAKEALLRKREYESYAAEMQPQWEAQASSVESLKSSLKDLQRKIEEAQRKKNILIARARRAEAQKRLQATMGSMKVDTSAFEAIDRMAEKIEKMEAENAAMLELADDSGEESLERQFKQIESSDSTADALLEDLKNRIQTGQIEDKT